MPDVYDFGVTDMPDIQTKPLYKIGVASFICIM